MLRKLGLVAATLAVALIAHPASPAESLLAVGPLNGNWLLKITNTEVPGTGEKALIEKSTVLLTFTDSDPGPNSPMTASFLGDGGEMVNLTGRRCGKAFALFVAGMDETLMLSGKAAINAKGVCTNLVGTASSIDAGAIVFTKFTGKRPPL